MNYNKWLSKNTHLLTNSLAIVVGATGSIGKEIVDYLLYLKAKVIIGARNVDKANHFRKPHNEDLQNNTINLQFHIINHNTK